MTKAKKNEKTAQFPVLPTILEYEGTISEFKQEIADYPAKLAAYLQQQAADSAAEVTQ